MQLSNHQLHELERLLGTAGVSVQTDGVVAAPATVEEVQALVRWASSEQLGLSIGSRPRPDGPSINVDLQRIHAVRFFEPRDLTIGVEAGMTVAQLAELAVGGGEFLPLDIAAPESTSVGALLAAHLSGPLRHGFGTVRDFTIGIEFVSADGKLIHGGGRVVKNVAGYDLMKLLIGSRGTLGIITAANFRLFPKLQPTQAAVIRLPSLSAGEALRSKMLHSHLRPLAFELVGGSAVVHNAEARETEVATDVAQPSVYVRFAGREADRKRNARDLAELAHAAGGESSNVDDEHSTWERIIKLTAPEHAEDYSCLLLSAPPARAMACLENIAGLLSPRSVRFQGRLALGVFSLYVEPAIDLTSLATIRKVLQPSSGFVEVTGGAFVPGPERTGPTATDAELMRQLKQQLDPLRIFEPAIFVA